MVVPESKNVKYQCGSCGSYDCNVTLADSSPPMLAYHCDKCGNHASGTKGSRVPSNFIEYEDPDVIGGPSIMEGSPITVGNFWDRYVREHVPEFYGDTHFALQKFKINIEPGKSYIIAEGIGSYRQSDGSFELHRPVNHTKRFPDPDWERTFWDKMVKDFDLSPQTKRAVIEAEVAQGEVEIKVAVILRQSVQKEVGRTLTQAEKDMLQAKVVKSTPDGNPRRVYYVARGAGYTYLGKLGAEVSSPRRAQQFDSRSACEAMIRAVGSAWKWTVEERRE